MDDCACTEAVGDRTEVCGTRRRDKEGAKRALMDAARAVFSERGFDAATTREVAARAGLNEQLIQRYFGGKAGLLAALVECYGCEETADALPPPAATPEAEIESFLSHQIGSCWQRRDLAKVVMDRALVDPGIARRLSDIATGCRMSALLDRLEAFRARGEVAQDVDLRAVAQGVATLAFGLGFLDRVVFEGCPQRVDEILRTHAQLIARGLRPAAA